MYENKVLIILYALSILISFIYSIKTSKVITENYGKTNKDFFQIAFVIFLSFVPLIGALISIMNYYSHKKYKGGLRL